MYPLPALSCCWAPQRLQAEVLEERQESVAVQLLDQVPLVSWLSRIGE